MNTDFRALCADLLEAYEWCIDEYMTAPASEDTLVQRARAALAQSTSEGD
jgi:DNA-binding response OmpR family regulator